MSKLEKHEESAIANWCKANNVLFIKFTPFGSKGWPDRIAVFRGGCIVWVELKRKGKKPTKLQALRMATLSAMGCITMWFDNAEACIDYFKECKAAADEIADEVQREGN